MQNYLFEITRFFHTYMLTLFYILMFVYKFQDFIEEDFQSYNQHKHLVRYSSIQVIIDADTTSYIITLCLFIFDFEL